MSTDAPQGEYRGDETCPSLCAERSHPGREHDPETDGCYCADLCSMGPTCPGANAGLDRGCTRSPSFANDLMQRGIDQMNADLTGEKDSPVSGHENISYDLGTPRKYTARKGWNIKCECGAPLGDTGHSYHEQEALYREHLAEVAALPPRFRSGKPEDPS